MATFGGQNFSDDDIRNFFATTDNAGIAAKAASLGMTADQVSQAARIAGRNWSASDITNWAVGNGYGFNASGAAQRAPDPAAPAAPAAAPAPAAPAWNRYAVAGTNANLPADYSAAQNLIAGNASNPNLDPNSRFNTGNFGGGRHLTVQQIRDFAATNPTNEQILEQAAAYGMNQEQLARALVYGRGDTLNDLTTNQMVNDSSNYGYTSEGLITALNGRSKSAQNGNSALTVNGGGSGGSGGGGSSSGSSGGIVASAMSPNSATVQNWNVTAPQTVNQQVANIVAQDSPLMQQARARAMMAANERGLVNSSMAVGDAQSAVLDRAIEIGSRDASTNAQAAQFNANAANQNSMFNVGQNNQWGTNALDRQERALDREQSASERAKDRAAAIAAAGVDAQTRRELAALEQTYRTQLNSDEGFDRQFSQYTETLLRIDTIEGLDAPAKAAMKAEALRALQNYATVRNLNLDLNFGTQPTAPAPAQSPTTVQPILLPEVNTFPGYA